MFQKLNLNKTLKKEEKKKTLCRLKSALKTIKMFLTSLTNKMSFFTRKFFNMGFTLLMDELINPCKSQVKHGYHITWLDPQTHLYVRYPDIQ